jgi:hypothetical protein
VREAAVREADEVLMEQALVRMSADGFAAVTAPAEPVRLFRRKAPRDAASEG